MEKLRERMRQLQNLIQGLTGQLENPEIPATTLAELIFHSPPGWWWISQKIFLNHHLKEYLRKNLLMIEQKLWLQK